jgi:hypothetical protein
MYLYTRIYTYLPSFIYIGLELMVKFRYLDASFNKVALFPGIYIGISINGYIYMYMYELFVSIIGNIYIYLKTFISSI